MREQKTSYIPFVFYEGDSLPTITDILYTDTAQTTRLDLNNSTATLWVFPYDTAVDFNAPTVSGTATISGMASSGVVQYTFTTTQTTTLSADDISLFRAFWKIKTATDTLRIRIFTPFQFLKIT